MNQHVFDVVSFTNFLAEHFLKNNNTTQHITFSSLFMQTIYSVKWLKVKKHWLLYIKEEKKDKTSIIHVIKILTKVLIESLLSLQSNFSKQSKVRMFPNVTKVILKPYS